ncbi:right-handed parallel beta-helix repeat-containing protein [Thermoactinomyces daqus]|uniref:Right-handed parallel beta-helix repeat-containing protein n=1 Tax=Thermoactinomyces daqus TaxID=1329516 RepID=A0A7W2AHZ0_9BACL|nr:right-handed parallel beta-helix repeat-containing protein [Thermoactinomyces daqus]MBA4542700.1 right-handed parallel beta-helix repeat-containing protein [Thermoactinomyces daqus]
MEADSIRRICHLDQFPRCEGESDDTPRFRRAIEAVPDGGLLIIPDGHYFVKEIEIGKAVSLRFEGVALLEATDTSTRYLLKYAGKESPCGYVLAAPAARGDRSVMIAGSACDLQTGDMILLVDDTCRHSDHQAEVNAETHEIAAVQPAEKHTEIVLKDFVRLPKTISKTGRNLVKIEPLDHVTVENFRYRLKEGAVCGFGIWAKHMRHFRVSGLDGERSVESGIQVRRSLYVTVERFHLRNPQQIGSGQGYGIQFYGGNNHVIIRDGITWKMRHSVDLEGTFDALVENVTDYEGQGVSFLISHNGWCSDITFRQCQAIRSRSSGFVAESQGVPDPFSLFHHNIQILDCRWHRDRNPSDLAGYGFGVWFKCPVSGRISNFLARYGEGGSYTPGQDNGAIRLLPVGVDMTLEGIRGEGLRRGIILAHTGPSRQLSPSDSIHLQNVTLSHCFSALYIQHGTGKNLLIRDLTVHHIEKYLIEGNAVGGYRLFSIDGLTVTDSPNLTLFGAIPKPDVKKGLAGSLGHVRSDQECSLTDLKSGWSLTYEDIFLRGNGLSLTFSGRMEDSGANALPDGIIEGQTLTLISLSTKPFCIHSCNIRAKGNGTSLILSPENRSAMLCWQKGYWMEIM